MKRNRIFPLTFIVLISLFLSSCGSKVPNIDNILYNKMSDEYSTTILDKQKTGLSKPMGILCRAEDEIVCDFEQNKLKVFDIAGNFIREVGSEGSGELQFLRPTGITLYQDEIYVIDSGNKRIQILNSDLEYLDSIDISVELSTNEFDFYNDIAIDGNGGIYLSNYSYAPEFYRIFYLKENTKNWQTLSKGFEGYLTSYQGCIYAMDTMQVHIFGDNVRTQTGKNSFYKLNGVETEKIADLPTGYMPCDFLIKDDQIICYTCALLEVHRLNMQGEYQETLYKCESNPTIKRWDAYLDQNEQGTIYVTSMDTGAIYMLEQQTPDGLEESD